MNGKAFQNCIKKALKSNLFFLLLALLFLAGVWCVAFFAVANEFVVPSPVETIKELGVLFGEVGFWRSLSATLLRAGFGFVLSFVLGLTFGLIAYLIPSFGRFLSPLMAVMRSLPILAVTLLILLFTTPKSAPVVVAVFALLPILYTSVHGELCGVDRKLIEVCKVYNVPFWARVKKLYLPTLSIKLLREGAAALSFSLKLTVSAEVLSNTFLSIGGMMQYASYAYLTARLFAFVIVVCVLGLIVETLGGYLAERAERRAL
ncbi:MAG: ABC transporter permease subunit [Clostridia bacterium]|nr:ABC transporter permease subunit [Clostridia bacterium]